MVVERAVRFQEEMAAGDRKLRTISDKDRTRHGGPGAAPEGTGRCVMNSESRSLLAVALVISNDGRAHIILACVNQTPPDGVRFRGLVHWSI